jgi:hypothetical protein
VLVLLIFKCECDISIGECEFDIFVAVIWLLYLLVNVKVNVIYLLVNVNLFLT